jgi:hypothetical protein
VQLIEEISDPGIRELDIEPCGRIIAATPNDSIAHL